MNWLDDLGIGWEIALRQIYWRLPSAIRMRQHDRQMRKHRSLSVSGPRFADFLAEQAGPAPLLLVHSSLGGVAFTDVGESPVSGPAAGLWILGVLRKLVGSEGTLCMPTHPGYPHRQFMTDKSNLVLRYSPRETPSSVGLLSELFRRRPESLRSMHPLSSFCAAGPSAVSLLENNLNASEPLPHGVDSAYHRFCLQGGIVLGIGLSLIKALTIVHVAEETADQGWPVSGFFYRRRFEIVGPDGNLFPAVVRERRPEFVRALALSQLRRDLLREGLLRETAVDGCPIARAEARGVLEFMRDRQKNSTYPYYWPGLAAWGRPRPLRTE